MPALPSLQDTALDHLRVIRTLMERASLYRAVSAPAALAGGLLALAVAWLGFRQDASPPDDAAAILSHGRQFLGAWLGVLAVTSVINFFLLLREAGGRGQPLVSEGLRMALRAIVPPMLSGGVLGVCLIWFERRLELAALVWILCYGLALQATVSFAPRSIIRLARAFLIAGQVLVVCHFAGIGPGLFRQTDTAASLFLGMTFGLFHIVYAIAIFCTPKPVSEPAAGNAEVLE